MLPYAGLLVMLFASGLGMFDIASTAQSPDGDGPTDEDEADLDAPPPAAAAPPPPAALRPVSEDDDVVTATEGDEEWLLLAGQDQFTGSAGDDLADGGAGDDTLFGGAGDDTLPGGTGAEGGAPEGIDTLLGGDGDDLLILGPQDLAEGGDGADTFGLASGDGLTDPAQVLDFDPLADRLEVHYAPGPEGSPPPQIRLEAGAGNSWSLLADDALVARITAAEGTELDASMVTLRLAA